VLERKRLSTKKKYLYLLTLSLKTSILRTPAYHRSPAHCATSKSPAVAFS